MVLKGGEAVLKSIRFLKIEAADFEAYEGCATVQELSNWCQAQGFHLISKVAFAEHPTGGTYFDLFFERVFDNEALLRAADELQALAGAFDSLGMSEIGASIANAASALDARVPEPPGWWSGPFNGQEGRKALVLTALQRLQPRSILETGTFRGTTTRFFAENFSGPVYTCEIDKRWYLTAQRSFLGFPSIEIDLDDSRAFLLRKLANVEGPVLIYLDAHWSSDLPLAREIEIIISSSIDAVVFIDDFAVPGDRGYSFDDYGPGKRLTIELLNTVDPKGAALFFPTLSSANETGAKRGCAVIATGSGIHVLDHIDALKREPWPVTWPEAARPVPVGSNDMVYPPVASIHRLIGSTGMRDPLNYNVGVAAKPRMHPVHLRALLQSMYSSSSWRYTRPLRALAGLLGRPPATEIDIARLDEAGLLRLVEDMRRSTSWRLMAPLRLAKRLKVRLTRGPLALEQNDPSRTIVMGTDRSISRDDWTAIAAALDVKAIEHQPDTPAEGFIHSGIYDITAIASLYKGGRFIESFLRNITQQSWFHRSELIIIDADSPDGEADVILKYQQKYPNIVYVRTQDKIGIYEAWNMAVGMARGTYLTNTNVDDLRRADSFEIQAKALANNSSIDVVYQDFYYSFDDTLTFDQVAKVGIKSELPGISPHNLFAFNSPHNAPMWRKALHDRMGLFDATMISAGDHEFWLRCICNRVRFMKTEPAHVVYFQNPNGISTRPDTAAILEAKIIKQRYAPLLEKL